MKRAIYIVVLLSFVCALRAQTITSYSCDFENPSENAQWVLNAGNKAPQCNNHWYIGAAGSFGIGSSKGLYVSVQNADTMVNTYSTANSEYVSAYREMTLAAGTYTLRFDWQCNGDSADGVFVFWVDATTNTNSNYDKNKNLKPPTYMPAGTIIHRGKQIWQSESTTIISTGNKGKLVVVWYNIRNSVYPPAAAIDNIEIYQGTCSVPTDVKYNESNSSLTWNGSADLYDVIMYNTHSGTKTDYPNIQGKSVQFDDMFEEGMYNFYIRSSCGENCHSRWVFANKFVWIKGSRCIDMFDLTEDNSGAAKCFSGHYDYGSSGWNLKESAGAIDFGFDDEMSQHTIHYKQGERDPRTGNQLKTIPDGEIASVRLGGHWFSDGNMSSTVEYEYDVQKGVSDVLELKYAAILEYADYHYNPTTGVSEEARFKLEVLCNNQVIDQCAQGDFMAGVGESGSWHRYEYHYGENSTRDIFWCDWQTIAVSLRNYVGQKLTIRLTAYSCEATIHIGYAYFTINCHGGDLQGVACNDFSTDHFEAPEGFNYRWYKESAPGNVLGTNQRFDISPNDTSVYLVDLISKTKSQCYYTLEANPNPRFPQARASMKSSSAANCEHKVQFAQDCHVVRINRQTHDSIYTAEEVERIVWYFGDGTDSLVTMDKNVSHSYPAEGGTYNVTVKASMSGGICEDVYTFPVTLPDITSPDTHTNIHQCAEGTDYTTTDSLKNRCGCDSTVFTHYYFHSAYDTTYTDRMCEGGRYLFPGNGKYYTASIDTAVVLQSQYGCDSTIRLSLVVDPKLEVTYPNSLKVCIEDNAIVIPYEVVSGMLEDVHVYFSERDQERGFQPVYTFSADEPIRIPLPDGVRPDRYSVTLDFSSERCQMAPQTLPVMLTYPSSIVMQTGGFIAVQNADYNGGYEFTSFVWTKDGEPMDNSASYVPASAEDIGSVYVLTLTRQGEDYTVESCPIVYNPSAQGIEDVFAAGARVWPTSVRSGGALWLAPEACAIYSVLGTKVATYPQADALRSVSAPSQPGVYVVVFDNHQSSSIIVR